MCSYHRRHISHFAETAKSLYELTKKNIKIEWGEREQAAFEQLKTCLTSAPVIPSPISEGEYTLNTDARSHSFSSILYQNHNGVERVICYASRVLPPTEQHYCSTCLELPAVVLTSLMKTPKPLTQQARWLDLINEFDFRIVHRAGSLNGAADALSRRPCERDDIDKMCPQCRSKAAGIVRNGERTVSDRLIAVGGEQCRAIGRDAGEGGL
jgi:hypothetical protein